MKKMLVVGCQECGERVGVIEVDIIAPCLYQDTPESDAAAAKFRLAHKQHCKGKTAKDGDKNAS